MCRSGRGTLLFQMLSKRAFPLFVSTCEVSGVHLTSVPSSPRPTALLDPYSPSPSALSLPLASCCNPRPSPPHVSIFLSASQIFSHGKTRTSSLSDLPSSHSFVLLLLLSLCLMVLQIPALSQTRQPCYSFSGGKLDVFSASHAWPRPCQERHLCILVRFVVPNPVRAPSRFSRAFHSSIS